MRPIPPLLAALALALPPGLVRAETVYVNDPLTGPPQGAVAGVAVGQSGGSSGAGGWTTTGGEDTRWYTIPEPIPRGRVEVTLTNASLDTTLSGDEMDILVLYGETDHPEPVPYMPYERSNNFKAQLRIFGTAGSVAGAAKLELAICDAGPPGYHEACPANCYGMYETAYLGCAYCNVGWDAATEYRLVVQWDAGWMSYTRGVEAPVTIHYEGTYAPSSLRVRLGSPRNSAGSNNRMPIGVVFRDLLVAGDPGPAAPAACLTPPTITAVSVDPANGTGTEQVFHAVFEHSLGFTAFRVAQLTVGGDPRLGLPGLAVGYDQPAGRFYLGADTCAPGEARTLTDTYGRLYCDRSTVAGNGNLGIADWALGFDQATFAGTHGLWVDAKGGPGDPEPRLGWMQMGTYTVPAIAPTQPDASTPPLPPDAATPGVPEDGSVASTPADASAEEPADGSTAPRDGGSDHTAPDASDDAPLLSQGTCGCSAAGGAGVSGLAVFAAGIAVRRWRRTSIAR